MKNFLIGYFVVGIVCVMVAGCGTSETGSPEESKLAVKERPSGDQEVITTIQTPVEENLDAYIKVIQGKLGHLKEKRAELVTRVQLVGLAPGPQVEFDATLESLTRKGKEVQRQIAALKIVKGKKWMTLRPEINEALEEVNQSYDEALGKFSG